MNICPIGGADLAHLTFASDVETTLGNPPIRFFILVNSGRVPIFLRGKPFPTISYIKKNIRFSFKLKYTKVYYTTERSPSAAADTE